MVHHSSPFCQATASTQPKAISRAQLPLVLAKVNIALFARSVFDWFSIDLPALEGTWLAVDGKDLRGSIGSGQTRSEACVSVEKQAEDMPQDMPCHQDSEGHRYDFGFGMNWKGVISDARTRQYVGPIASKKAQ